MEARKERGRTGKKERKEAGPPREQGPRENLSCMKRAKI